MHMLFGPPASPDDVGDGRYIDVFVGCEFLEMLHGSQFAVFGEDL